MGKKLALKLSFTNLTRLSRCPYLYSKNLDAISGLLQKSLVFALIMIRKEIENNNNNSDNKESRKKGDMRSCME